MASHRGLFESREDEVCWQQQPVEPPAATFSSWAPASIRVANWDLHVTTAMNLNGLVWVLRFVRDTCSGFFFCVFRRGEGGRGVRYLAMAGHAIVLCLTFAKDGKERAALACSFMSPLLQGQLVPPIVQR